MKVKVCYKDEIHRISNLPDAFDDLVKLIPGIFHAQLPEHWTLQYKDSDGDNILITDEKDYEEFKNSEPGTASAMSKIYVISADAFKAPYAVVEEPNVIELEPTDIKREDDYQVIESEDKEEKEEKEENKPEEVIQIKEEVPEAVPVQEEQEKVEPKEIEEKEEIIKEAEVQEEPREPEEQQDEQVEEKVEEKVDEQERKEPEEPEKAEEQEDVKAPEELHEPEEAIEKEVQEEKEEKVEMEEKPVEQEEPKVPEVKEAEDEVRSEDDFRYYAPVDLKEQQVEEKPVEDREEEKSNFMESQYSKIVVAPKVEKVMEDSYEVLRSKLLSGMGVDDLKSLVSSLIEQKMPEIAQFTQQKIEEERSQLSQSMIVDQSLLVSDEFQANKPVAPKVIHYDIKCMGCGMAPIQGIRYKCTICPSFDYCEQCEEAGTHPHNFVKIRQRDVQDIFRPPQQMKPLLPKMPEWKKNEPAQPAPMKESEKKKPAQDANYYDNLVEKAKKLQKCFPKEDFDMLCVYISDAPEDMSIEELVENYKLGLQKEQ